MHKDTYFEGDKTNKLLSLLFHSQKKSVPELNFQSSYILSEYYISQVTCTNPTSDMFQPNQAIPVMCISYTTDMGKLCYGQPCYTL